MAPPQKLDVLLHNEFILYWWIMVNDRVQHGGKWKWAIVNVQLQSEDSNLVSPLELDVLVHVEQEHEHEKQSNSWENMPHLWNLICFWNALIILLSESNSIGWLNIMMMERMVRWQSGDFEGSKDWHRGESRSQRGRKARSSPWTLPSTWLGLWNALSSSWQPADCRWKICRLLLVGKEVDSRTIEEHPQHEMGPSLLGQRVKASLIKSLSPSRLASPQRRASWRGRTCSRWRGWPW